MKILNKCNHCFTMQEEFYCDTCEKELDCIPVTVSFGYGHILDGGEYHFCSTKCLLDFIEKEFKKEEKKPDKRFLFGKKEKKQ